ncbi:MAG: glutamate-5-semialdehyde dehydrogenase, partial [bacterium]
AIKNISNSLKKISNLEDPIGKIINFKKSSNGLQIGQMRVPLGVVGIIYEARPNVTIDAFATCFKSSNSVILRGGTESINSNIAFVKIIKKVLKNFDLENAVQIIENTDRKIVLEMLKLDKYIDVIIPRASQETIKYILKNTTIPVISHGEGNCHIYVDDKACLEMAEKIIFNAKVQKPSVCNAMETLLVHKAISQKFLPIILKKLKDANVEIRGCSETYKIFSDIKKASEEDFKKEFLDLILAVKVVKNIDEAIYHINYYGSHHSDAIITNSYEKSWKFLQEIDSSSVFVNASTRLADGKIYGLGAEIGISTQKLHARGPMGLENLTTTKFVILGNGQIRE